VRLGAFRTITSPLFGWMFNIQYVTKPEKVQHRT
jgi:hypothetical protein